MGQKNANPHGELWLYYTRSTMTEQERLDRCREIDRLTAKNWKEITDRWPNPYSPERNEIRRIKAKNFPTRLDVIRLLDIIG